MSNETKQIDLYHKMCDECQETHEKIAFCEDCGACLYKNSKQIPNDIYPIFECLKCYARNFWD